ncbi:hypothetical protein [Ramlibacter humi]|uniref:Histidine kinase n=1 Tax=Ramlibacter humi TaxID=2530451 RepID=A0A4Z0BSM7_9BURK|nr:hypothetical protein [Ramlibacter humi]TFZ01841.1 hypothetical protein EZ216_11665 [Ramlibacter humi]
MSASTPSSAQATLMLVESARYALLRRLAAAIRHQMVAHLQPIGMVSELLERRTRAASPDLAAIHDGAAKINSLSKAAAKDVLDVITWMSPEPGATMPFDAAVRDCVDLLHSNFSFRGFNLAAEVSELPQPVGRAAARMLLPAALLALTDTQEGPADVVISARTGEDVIHVEIRFIRTEGDGGYGSKLSYRSMEWGEVNAMARAEDVELSYTESTATLAFPVLA